MSANERPRLGVVIATHNRPVLMRKALASVLDQTYVGPIEVIVVFDRSEADFSIERDDPVRRVRVTRNTRTPGLAGARNTGILDLDTEFVAFCDDDDIWLAGKIDAQMDLLQHETDAEFVTTAMRVDYGDRLTVRRAGKRRVTIDDFARSRMSMLHSSSFVFRRSAMLGGDGFGLVDETIPRSMGEDWDLLLRASRRRPVDHIDEPLVSVLWGQSSYFNEAWADKNAACEWLIEHHPEIRADRTAMALQLGKLAFGHAALKQRREALTSARRAVRQNWREHRTLVALFVLVGVRPEWIIRTLNRRGHGI